MTVPEPAQPPPSHADPALVSNHEDPRAAARDRAAIRAAIRAEAEAMVDRALADHHNRAVTWRGRALRAEVALIAAYVLVGILCAWAVIT